LFSFFNEISIINQLSSNLFQKRLPDGVTIAQFSVLNHLIRVQDGQTPLVLASAFQVPKTSMTHSLASLEKRGLITMKPNLEDGRSKCVWLTQTGRAFRDQAITNLAEDLMRIAPKLDIEEVMGLLPTLAKVRSVLDEDRN
jgi:DNA-binding MarR family transcriptional regulator